MKHHYTLTVETIDPEVQPRIALAHVEPPPELARVTLTELDHESRFGTFGAITASIHCDEERNFTKFPEHAELRIHDENMNTTQTVRFESVLDIMLLADALTALAEREPLRRECGCW